MSNPKYDYFKKVELMGLKPLIVRDEKCPKCDSKLGLIYPETIWCVSDTCNYSVMNLGGTGVMDIPVEGVQNEEDHKVY